MTLRFGYRRICLATPIGAAPADTEYSGAECDEAGTLPSRTGCRRKTHRRPVGRRVGSVSVDDGSGVRIPQTFWLTVAVKEVVSGSPRPPREDAAMHGPQQALVNAMSSRVLTR